MPADAASAVTDRTVVVQGRSIALPVRVRDATAITAAFVVPTRAVRALVRHPALHVVELLPGRTVCVLAGVEYRDNDLGPYLEVGVSFFVRHGGPAPWPLLDFVRGFVGNTLGAYIHRLPVTTEFSRAAGADIWGFPKTVDEITCADDGPRRTMVWRADGRHVLSLTVARGGRMQMPETPQEALAVREGVLWRTPSALWGTGFAIRPGGATLALGDHPVADELRTLGLPRGALFTTATDRMQARFDAPQRC